MKKLLILLLLILSALQGYSQTEGITYQAVILSPEAQEIPGVNVQNNILVNTQIAIQFTIIDNTSNEEYKEQHITSTDAYGMINLIIGEGDPISTNSFSDIVWSGTSKLLKVDIDFSGSGNFILLGEQNLTYIPQPATAETLQMINDNLTRILAEQLRAETEEAVLQSNINTLQLNTDVAIVNIQSDVDANEAASAAADTVLQNNIDTLQSNVDANETSTNMAIANVQSDVDTNEAASDAADVTLQNNIDTVQADVDANETATNTAIADVQSDVDTNEVATINALDLKVDKETGKGLSTEDYSTAEKTKLAAISGTNTGDQDLTSYVTNTNLALKANIASPTFTGTVGGIDKTMVGLGNVDNTSDANKPVSTATQTALDLKVDKETGKGLSTEDYSTAEKTKLAAVSGTNTGDQDLTSYATNTNLALKANIASPTFTGTVGGIDKTMVGLGNVDNTSDANKPVSTATQTALDLKVDKEIGKGLSTEDYSTAEKTKLAAISGTNTGDQDLSSYATNTNLALKANIASPTFTGTVGGIDKTMVGLGNVDNTSDANKPVSTATQTALDLKVDKETGKGLSTEDYSTAEKTKLAAISGTNTGDQDISEITTNATSIATNVTAIALNTAKVGVPVAYTLPNTDGTANQVLQTNGSGVLSWNTPSTAAPVREVADEFNATASQTSFTLTQTPSIYSKVKMYINGIRISNTAYSVSGTTLTYVPVNNGGYALSISDRIQFDFYY